MLCVTNSSKNGRFCCSRTSSQSGSQSRTRNWKKRHEKHHQQKTVVQLRDMMLTYVNLISYRMPSNKTTCTWEHMCRHQILEKICTKRANNLYLHPVLCRIIPPLGWNPTHLVSIEIKRSLCRSGDNRLLSAHSHDSPLSQNPLIFICI